MGTMKKKEIIIGFIIAIFATIAGFYVYVEYALNLSFSESLNIIHQQNLFGKVLVLSAIPNLFVFFIFLKKKQDLRARGVLMACLLIAILVFISQFL